MAQRPTWVALLGGFLSAAVFCMRWRFCLPFSGQMPAIENRDLLTAWGIHLIYAKEPISFPLGVVHGLSFPFGDSYDLLSRGPIALFSIFFKVVGKVIPYFGTFYYFPLLEILAVFATAYFAARIIQDLGVATHCSAVLGGILTGLSFPLLFRSSSYYGLTRFVLYAPLFLGYAYAIASVARGRRRQALFGISTSLIFSSLIDSYLFLAMLILSIGTFGLSGVRAVFYRNPANIRSARLIGGATLIGIALAFLSLEAVGNFGRLEAPTRRSVMAGRYGTEWGYGGGMGGGFHVADLLTPIIPPEGGEDTPASLQGGPASYPTRLGWPLTTASLGPGQYEGFAYVGTIPLLVAILLTVGSVRRFRGRFSRPWDAATIVLRAEMIRLARLSWPVTLALPAFLLFVLSLGYIIHVGGVRFDRFPAPALYAVAVYPKLLFARALGRFDVPFVLFLLIATTVWLDRAVLRIRSDRRLIVPLIGVLLVGAHIGEVRGYLVSPSSFPSDVIANEFRSDSEALNLLGGPGPIIPVPGLRDNIAWGRVCYALAYHTGRPLGGAVVGLGVPASHEAVFSGDRNAILEGRVSDLIDRYGETLIALSPGLADSVAALSGGRLQRISINSEKVALYMASGERR